MREVYKSIFIGFLNNYQLIAINSICLTALISGQKPAYFDLPLKMKKKKLLREIDQNSQKHK